MSTIVPNTGTLSFSYFRNLIPGTAALWFELSQGFSYTVAPLTASLNFTGYQSPQLLTTPAPLNAQVGFVGAAPIVSIGIQTHIIPSVGALALSGIAPINKLGLVINPNSGSVTLNGQLVNLSISFNSTIPGTGTLNLVGTTPILQQQVAGTIGTYAGAFVGAAPILKQSVNITPSTGGIGVTGQTEQSGILEIPNVGALLATGYVPTWNLNDTIGTGSLGFTGTVPLLGAPTSITPNTGAVVINGQSVGVGIKGTIVVQTGALGITGAAPLLGVPTSITTNTGALGVAGTVPLLGVPTSITPGAGSLGATGIAPIEHSFVTITANLGGATFIGAIPVILQVAAIVPQTGTLGFLGVTPQSVAAFFVQPSTGSMQSTAQGASPSVQIFITPQNATALSVNGNPVIVTTLSNIVTGTGSMGMASDAGQSVVPQFKFPLTQDMFFNSDPPIVFQLGPPEVDVVPVALLQNSVSIEIDYLVAIALMQASVQIQFILPGSSSMPSPTVSVNEQNSLTVLIGPFLDINGVPYLPQALAWLLWDDTNKIEVQAYTNLTPDFTVTFEIAGNLNAINNPSNLSERRMVLIQTTLPGGETRTDPAYYNVIALPDLGP